MNLHASEGGLFKWATRGYRSEICIIIEMILLSDFPSKNSTLLYNVNEKRKTQNSGKNRLASDITVSPSCPLKRYAPLRSLGSRSLSHSQSEGNENGIKARKLELRIFEKCLTTAKSYKRVSAM